MPANAGDQATVVGEAYVPDGLRASLQMVPPAQLAATVSP